MAFRAILIAGPTASGKSHLAMRAAKALGGEIVGADSMQVYRELRIITARPGPEDTGAVPHHLYGVLSVREVCSAGRWLDMLAPVLDDLRARETPAIIVGGTGLYFKAALEGLAPTPEIPDAVRRDARDLMDRLGPEALHARLQSVDPDSAARLGPTDSQRIARAWEVWQATGKPLSAWQADVTPGPLAEDDRAGRVEKLAILPHRDWLYPRINARFEQMVREGALEEARILADMDLPADHPAMKALGIPPLLGFLRGERELESAIAEGQKQTRHYAKRQMTWIRHQFAHWRHLDEQEMKRFFENSFSII